MPRRDDNRNVSPAGAQAPRRVTQPVSNVEDKWDEVMNMKSGGSSNDGSFNKMNTNFFLKDGEEIEVVLLDDAPTMFYSHTIKCKSQDGKTFYRVEQCQKSEQDHCVLCSTNNKAVSPARKSIAFRILDSRGSWDKESSALDGIPVPKIFLTPLYLAKQLKNLLDEAGGTLKDKVLKLSKKTQYMVGFKFNKLAGGGFDYVLAPEYDGELPEVLEVYAPMTDSELSDFVTMFGDATDAKSSIPVGRAGGQRGSFS